LYLMIRYLKNKRGQAVVEFALILPVLMLLVVGILEFGIIMNQYMVVNEAAREGARSAALGNTNATVTAIATAAASPINTSQLTVAISPTASRTSGSQVTVTVSNPVQAITTLISPFFPTGFKVQGVATMRME